MPQNANKITPPRTAAPRASPLPAKPCLLQAWVLASLLTAGLWSATQNQAQAALGLEAFMAKARYLYERDSRGPESKVLLDPLRTTQDPGRGAITLYSGPKTRRDVLGLDSRYIGGGLRFDANQSIPVGDLSLGIHLSAATKPESQSPSVLSGTEMALRFAHAEIYAGSQPRHWGPSWVGSLILDQSAATLWSVGVRRPLAVESDSKWLSWIGPWAGDFFVSKLEGHTNPARPYLIGMRVLLAPTPGLEIGLSRAMQWGGQGRDESWSSLLNGLLGKDNTGGGGITFANEPGNQLGGFDVRYSRALSDRYTAAIYGQMIGEDEARSLPSKYMYQLGAELAQNRGAIPWRLFVEGTTSKAELPGVAYRHSVYAQGFTHRSLPLAYPLGGDVRLNSVGILASGSSDAAAVLMLHSGKTLPGSQFYRPDGAIQGAQLGLMIRKNNIESGLMLSHFRAPDIKENSAQLFAKLKF